MRTYKNKEEGYTMEASFYWEGIKFDTVEKFFKILKTFGGFTWENVKNKYLDIEKDDIEYFNPEYSQLLNDCEKIWHDENIKPWTIDEINLLDCEEQKEVLSNLIKKSIDN